MECVHSAQFSQNKILKDIINTKEGTVSVENFERNRIFSRDGMVVHVLIWWSLAGCEKKREGVVAKVPSGSPNTLCHHHTWMG